MRVNMTPEEAMEIEVRQLKEMAARFGGAMDREREKRRAAYRGARAICKGETAWDSRR